MRLGICILCLILIPDLLLAAASPDELVNQAAEAYAQGEYEVAVELYEQIVASGIRSDAVYFNLGNAYYQLDDLGRALLNYRRAQFRSPRNSTISANLSLIRALRIDFQRDEVNLMDRVATITENTFSLDEHITGSVMMWSMWFFGIAMWIWLRPNRKLAIWLIASGILLGALLGMLVNRVYVATERPPAVVVSVIEPVMSGPGQNYLTMFHLYAGTEMRILSQQGAWIRFLLPDGRQGWISRDAVGFV